MHRHCSNASHMRSANTIQLFFHSCLLIASVAEVAYAPGQGDHQRQAYLQPHPRGPSPRTFTPDWCPPVKLTTPPSGLGGCSYLVPEAAVAPQIPQPSPIYPHKAPGALAPFTPGQRHQEGSHHHPDKQECPLGAR